MAKTRERNRGDLPKKKNDRVDPHLQMTGGSLVLADVVEDKSKWMPISGDVDVL